MHYKWREIEFEIVNRLICYRVEPTAMPLDSGKVLLARIETITLSCVVF